MPQTAVKTFGLLYVTYTGYFLQRPQKQKVSWTNKKICFPLRLQTLNDPENSGRIDFGKKLIAKGHFLKPLYVEDGAFIRPWDLAYLNPSFIRFISAGFPLLHFNSM